VSKNKNILILIAHYLPGQNIGGPLNSVFNIIQSLKNEFDFFLLTSDRDMGSNSAYQGISVNSWIEVEGAKVMYLQPGLKYYFNVYKHLRYNIYDVIYLNSLFDFKFSIYIMILKYFKLIKVNQIIIAPRGELIDGALNLRINKKKAFLGIINFINFYKDVVWHSTADIETKSIKENVSFSQIRLARVLANSDLNLSEIDDIVFHTVGNSFLKVIFLSRISKEKNLAFALRVLQKVSCLVEFHIYGPIEEDDIWKQCIQIIKTMPKNVKVFYNGIVKRDLVKSYFIKYDLFLFPTLIENYGHVINESLSVGTPVLISDRTPWRYLEIKGLGWDYNLSNIDDFVKQIEEYSKLDLDEKSSFRKHVINNYGGLNNKNILIKENLNLFEQNEN
jgi:glycosyltransferase involved in cell wall biosynthesis